MFGRRLRGLLIGAPRDLRDRGIFHRLALVAFLAWVGLGADGLSSSSYGPSEAFHALGAHRYLAVGLAALTAFTVIVIAAAYSRIVEAFPHGGGGYLVATQLLGPRAGVVSGCALLVDYVMTITVSMAAAGDALFSLMPPAWHAWKLPGEALLILLLILLNLRGVRESVLALLPIFLLFLATHTLLIGGGIALHWGDLPASAAATRAGFAEGMRTVGAGGMLLLFLHAYSLGGGTYTGLEAVSNGLPIMREPRVATARRTMTYMAVSLALTAGGLLLCYLLWDVRFLPGKTLNASLAEQFSQQLGLGRPFVMATLVSEGALLIAAAQAGFIDGPRVLANMSIDSWFPRRFSALSDRLTIQNGVLLMGGAALLALFYTRGSVRHLVVMYSINVFLTFSLSMLGMLSATLRRSPALATEAAAAPTAGAAGDRASRRRRSRRATLFGTGFVLCATILVVTTLEKFREGGWLTLAVTGLLVLTAVGIRRHYRRVGAKLTRLYEQLTRIPLEHRGPARPLDPEAPTAVLLVGGYGGLGIHTLLSSVNLFPGQFRNVLFASAGVIDSEAFKGAHAVDELRAETSAMLRRYVDLAHGLGLAAGSRLAIGTDAVDTLEKLCLALATEYPRATFFAGKIVFERDRWYQRLLHNETAFALQRRLQWAGLTMIIVPARMT